MATVVSADQEHDSDVLALIGASCAMNLSDIPFPEPIAGVRVGRVDGEFVIMPTFEQLDGSDMDVVVAGTADNIIMVEGGTREVSESDMIAALEFAHGTHPRDRDGAARADGATPASRSGRS
mgnify:CR=1 FL=1